jgi:hypothetical protein
VAKKHHRPSGGSAASPEDGPPKAGHDSPTANNAPIID